MSQRPAADSAGGNSTRGVILLLVALVLGIFILSETETGLSTTEGTKNPTTTKPSADATTTSTRPPRPPAAIKVLAANGSGVSGLAAKTGDRLTAAGYNSLAPATAATEVSTSAVAFTPGFDLEAFYVALALGLRAESVQALDPANPPVADTKGAEIVVLVGPDLDITTPAAGGAVTTTTIG